MSITVHHLNYSRSLRALWLLEELELDYSLRQWERDENFRAPTAAQQIHPLGRFPMVEVDGHVLVESGAILEYFADREGRLRPTDEKEARACTLFLHYGEASAMPPLLVQLILDKARDAPMPFLVRPLVKAVTSQIEQAYSGPAITLHFDFLDKTMAERPYFAGQAFSIADIQMYYPVEAALSRGKGTWPNLSAWLARVTDRPAYRRAREKGGAPLPG